MAQLAEWYDEYSAEWEIEGKSYILLKEKMKYHPEFSRANISSEVQQNPCMLSVVLTIGASRHDPTSGVIMGRIQLNERLGRISIFY